MSGYNKILEDRLRELRFDIQDNLDDKNNPVGRSLIEAAQKCEDMAEGNKNLRSIESELKRLEQDLQRSQDQPPDARAMSPHDSEALSRRVRDMCMDIRKQPEF